MKAGQRVLISDQGAPIEGVIVEVSDWAKVNGPPNAGVCYLIKSKTWPEEQWTGALFLKGE